MPLLHWLGKDKIVNYAQKAPFHLLEKRYQYGDASLNKIIHGDNLLALKSLLPQYEGRIKCIYIDPPYNTGNENWVYNDNVNSPQIQKWLGQVVGKPAEDFSRHDKWLCMMYPRLQLLQRLLADNGVIFISIDDNEQAHLKLICDEIFGEFNYLGLITRKQSSGSKNDMGSDKVITTADYILSYKKNTFSFLPYQIKNTKKFNFEDKEGFFSIRALEMQGGGDTLSQRPKMGYSIYYNQNEHKVELLFDYNLENTPIYEQENSDLILQGYKCYRPRKRGLECGRWRWGSETFIERFNKNLVYFDKNRVFMKEREASEINKYPEAVLEDYLNTQGTNEVKEIFNYKVFDYPKPSELVKFLCSVSTDKNDIILDSFAGSGTTAHAVMNLNKADGGNRQFILIETEDYAETITAERVRRVMAGYSNTEGLGGGFEYYELGQLLFLENGFLNEEVSVEQIKEYVYYTETKQVYQPHDGGYSMGEYEGRGYYFYYEKDSECTLNMDFVATINYRSQAYTVYADVCGLSEAQLEKYNITYKKIPRDISRL